MGDHDVAIAGFYDHEEHEQRRTPDWGGDDLFTGAAPRRRRFPQPSAPRAARIGDRAGHPVRSRDTGEHRSAPHREHEGRATPAAPVTAPAPAPIMTDYLEPVPEGRRTITITGRPDRAAVARRPARTLDDHMTHRPERILSWTCAMGVLLILLAVLTAH